MTLEKMSSADKLNAIMAYQNRRIEALEYAMASLQESHITLQTLLAKAGIIELVDKSESAVH